MEHSGCNLILEKPEAESAPNFMCQEHFLGAALFLTATSLEELQRMFVPQALALHPSKGGSLDEFNCALSAFSALCHGFANCGKLQWIPAHPKSANADASLRELQTLLRRLCPDRRRQAIERCLSLHQRRQLEQWMLRKQPQKVVGKSKRRGVLTERSLCKRANGKFRPFVHLHAGLYAQTRTCRDLGLAVSGIGTLILMQALCRAGSSRESGESVFSPQDPRAIKVVATELQIAIKESLASRYLLDKKIGVVFRTRIAICDGELATPTRRDPESALEDWSTVQRAAAMGFRTNRDSCQTLLCALRGARTSERGSGGIEGSISAGPLGSLKLQNYGPCRSDSETGCATLCACASTVPESDCFAQHAD
ncbi:unnamed protein product [Symbiodinium natans]|uniref:Uncharacterized protein n=1 Tax=Symbiodinium natans TaxID=878477 RepID=A0A812S5J4_9DINO|nr:unnamed protein product [Symbiodinium natans]